MGKGARNRRIRRIALVQSSGWEPPPLARDTNRAAPARALARMTRRRRRR